MVMRLIVVGVVQNKAGEILICKMPRNRGVFPGQWGLPGGGIEEGETVETALRRELEEEVGLEVTNIRPLFFTDGVYQKTFPDGSRQEIYMLFLLFSCQAQSEFVRLIGRMIVIPVIYAVIHPETFLIFPVLLLSIYLFRRIRISALQQDQPAAGTLGLRSQR